MFSEGGTLQLMRPHSKHLQPNFLSRLSNYLLHLTRPLTFDLISTLGYDVSDLCVVSVTKFSRSWGTIYNQARKGVTYRGTGGAQGDLEMYATIFSLWTSCGVPALVVPINLRGQWERWVFAIGSGSSKMHIPPLKIMWLRFQNMIWSACN